MKIPTNVTPLVIIAAFLCLTESVLGIAATQVADGAQITLIVFVIIFPVIVFLGFWVMLWHRPENFYPPSEYKNVSPENFISALRQSNLPKKVVEQLDSISQNPTDKIAQFALIDSMLDETHRQYLILMHTVPCELPFSDPRSGIDFYEMEHRISADKVTGSAGDFVIKEFYKKIEGTNFVSIISTGTKLSLTPSGHEFAQWLIDDGRKASYFETSYGKWGEPLPDGPVVEWRRTRAQWQQRNV